MLGITLLLALALFGCGDGTILYASNEPCDGFGCGYDFVTAEGVRVRNERAPQLTTFDQADVERLFATPFREVADCMQLQDPPGPLVVISELPLSRQPVACGVYFNKDGTILLSTQCVFDESVVKHEYVHYLLGLTGFPAVRNDSHDSPLFLTCAGQ